MSSSATSRTDSTKVIDPTGTWPSADHLGMSGVADEEDVASFLNQALRLAMDLETSGQVASTR
jgi:hypothetical protein